MGVDGRFVRFLRFVEAEAIASTVPGAVQLLQQEDYSLMDDPEHPQSVHTLKERRNTFIMRLYSSIYVKYLWLLFLRF